MSLQNNVNCSLAQRTVWRPPHFANAVSSLLFWSPASGSGFGGLCRRSASVLYYYVLLSRFLTIHPYSRAEVLLTFLAYINRKSFWLLSDEDKAVWKYLVDTKFWKNKLKTKIKIGTQNSVLENQIFWQNKICIRYLVGVSVQNSRSHTYKIIAVGQWKLRFFVIFRLIPYIHT